MLLGFVFHKFLSNVYSLFIMGKTKVVEKKGTRGGISRASKPRSSGRKPLNRYMLETESESVSTSAKKLKLSEHEYHINVDATLGYRVINFVTVFAAISEFLQCAKSVNLP